jgi:hypothetical protein
VAKAKKFFPLGVRKWATFFFVPRLYRGRERRRPKGAGKSIREEANVGMKKTGKRRRWEAGTDGC